MTKEKDMRDAYKFEGMCPTCRCTMWMTKKSRFDPRMPTAPVVWSGVCDNKHKITLSSEDVLVSAGATGILEIDSELRRIEGLRKLGIFRVWPTERLVEVYESAEPGTVTLVLTTLLCAEGDAEKVAKGLMSAAEVQLGFVFSVYDRPMRNYEKRIVDGDWGDVF